MPEEIWKPISGFEGRYEVSSLGRVRSLMDNITAMCMRQFQLAMDGDTKAFVKIRNSLGEQPIQCVEVDTINPQARAEMDELLGLNEKTV